MGEPRMIGGCLVLQEAPAHKLDRHKVVLCELPAHHEANDGTHAYVVWYIDHNDRPSGGKFYATHQAAQAEFERRT